MTTVLVADDHPMFREALADALRSIIENVDVIESGSMLETIGAVSGSPDIDLILLDLRMPGVNGVKGVRTLRVRRPDVPVAVISALSDSFVVRECFEAGAIGYIPKSLSRAAIATAISTILEGGSYSPSEGIEDSKPEVDSDDLDDAVSCRFELLTNQQRRVLELMAAGLLNKQIAYEIDVQITTVKAHVSSLLQKLGVSSRTQAVILYQKYNKAMSLANRRDQGA